MSGQFQVSAALLSAAAYLCCAVDDLRAAGLARLADRVDAFVAVLDAKIDTLDTTVNGRAPRVPARRLGAKRRKALVARG